MNAPVTLAQAIYEAQKALQRGDKHAVRHWAEQAAALEPNREEPWLLLAAVASPRASIDYLQRALAVNPHSERAQKGMAWAQKRLQNAETTRTPLAATQKTHLPETLAATRPQQAQPGPAETQPTRTQPPGVTRPVTIKRVSLKNPTSVILLLLACALIATLVFVDTTPALAFINSLGDAPQGHASWAPVMVAKPAAAALPPAITDPTPATLPTLPPNPTDSAAPLNTEAAPQSDEPSQADPTQPAEAAATTEPGSTEVAVVAEPSPTPLPTDTPAPAQDPVVVANNPPGAYGAKWILVDISEQHLYAYEGETLIYSFVASTGMNNATRVGTFSVLDKIPNAYGSTWNIWMPDWMGIYYAGSLENGIHSLPILPNGQRLWAGYLGTPISYGCVVLGIYESRMLYDWAEVGTPVQIQW